MHDEPTTKPITLRRAFVGAFLAWATSAVAQPGVLWLRTAGGAGSEYAYDIALGPDGSVVITGNIEGTASFGPDVELASAGEKDIFIAKYDGDGRLLWAQRAGSATRGALGEWGHSIATDRDGNIVVAGAFVDTADFGGLTLSRGEGSAPRWENPFVAKYDGGGRALWVRTVEGRLGGVARGVGSDAAGNVFAGGNLGWTLCYPRDGDASTCAPDAFLVKYDPRGNELWRKQIRGLWYQQIHDIAVDPQGNAVVWGLFTTEAIFDPSTTLRAVTPEAMFLAKYDSTGRLLWARQVDLEDLDRTSVGHGGWAIALDESGNIFVTADFHGTATFAPERRISSRSRSDIFLAKYTPSGTFLWATHAGGTSENTRTIRDEGTGLAVDRFGNAIVAGRVTDFAMPGVTDLGPQNAFVTKYNPDGMVLWHTPLAGHERAAATAVAAGRSGRLYTAGVFNGGIDGESGRIQSAGYGDVWVAELGTRPTIDDDTTRRFESSAWEHVHALCPVAVRRALLDPDARCPGVFENRPLGPETGDPPDGPWVPLSGVAPSGAVELWTLEIGERTLDDGTDADVYEVVLPDPGSAIYPGHDDIRPRHDPFRASTPEPMAECGVVQRQELGPGVQQHTTNVSTAGQVTVTVIPSINSRSDRAVTMRGERVRLYRGDAAADDFGTGTAWRKTLTCPHSEQAPATLRFSFGDREPGDGPRSVGATGGYTVLLEYVVDATREIPDWAVQEMDAKGIRAIGSLPCFGLDGRGGKPSMPGLGFFPNESFPSCAPPGIDWARIDLEHPMGFGRKGVPAVVQPTELFAVAWAADDKFQAVISTASELSVTLFDQKHVAVGRANPFKDEPATMLPPRAAFAEARAEAGAWTTSRLTIPKLERGTYVLEVAGAPGPYRIDFAPPGPSHGGGASNAGRGSAWRWIVAVAIAVIVVLVWLGVRRGR